MREFLDFSRHSLTLIIHVRGVILVLTLALICCAAVISFLEGLSLGDALYFTLITGLTIGYGDITLTSATGRLLSVLAGVIGVIFVGIVVAIATHALKLTANEELARKEKRK